MNRTRRGTAAVVLALALPLSASTVVAHAVPSPPLTTAASDGAATVPRLPRPTGPFAVGREIRHLVDEKRRDPWVPTAGARELMVSMYYPARADGSGARAPYLTDDEAEALLESQKLTGVVGVEQVTGTRTNARTGARPIDGRHPLVVLSPGFSLTRGILTGLSEELASRGYVVALLDHAYESFGTSFPGGRTLTCAACDVLDAAPTDEASSQRLAEAAADRAADISFVVDELTRRPTAGRPALRRHAAMIDPKRVGAAGHSLGGNASAHAMTVDRRIRAGVNMDGTFFRPVPATGLDGRPFLMLGTLEGHAPTSKDATWPTTWQRLDGWKRWLTVRDSGHFTFIDLPVLAAQLGMTDPSAPLPGPRSGEITTSYVGAFFDQELRGIHQPLLDGPTEDNPEVTFQNP
ncbi:lipase [Streptomyces camponoticapitis]|uniref:Lipase n=1 Tax=Streptomyces camponoticapitis TaxID=1616125 RepID=A0ABQ2E824_9ACTN|nr:alpha/beta hydrolase [Streptomyces camponoticapitis]GGJ99170.1 lipase [Streptomyces camponoticapitis]